MTDVCFGSVQGLPLGRAVKKTQAVIEEIKRLGETGFVEFEYPPETLHEIITNSVLHRD